MARWYFAWVDEEDSEWDDEFLREDEEIVSLTRDQAEGDFASLSIDIRNPHVGLLAPGRKLWAWVTYETDAEVVHPFFFGQIVAFPEDIQQELITLLFVAKPSDVVEQKEDMAETLRVAPFWDPVFVKKDNIENPDVVLDARPYRWHFDPITHEVTVSHITNAEDGSIAFGEGEVLYDGSSFSYSTAPLAQLKLEAKVNWTQRAKGGGVDLKPAILKAFSASGSTNPWMVQSYTAGGLVGAWPVPGVDMGGGWKIEDTNVEAGRFMSAFVDSIIKVVYVETEEDDSIISLVQPQLQFPQEPKRLHIPLGQLDIAFLAQYDAQRTRTETLVVTMTADVQRLTSDPATIDTVTLESNDVSEPVDEDESTDGLEIPIGDVRRNSYFKTDRGHDSAEYVLALGGTIMLRRARAVELSFRTAFDAGLDVTLRKEINPLTHRLIPGGVASGKVIALRMAYTSDEPYAEIAIGCCIGRGGTLVADAGEPTYVDDDYVEDDYQARAGELREVLPNLLYNSYDEAAIVDDGYSFLSPVTAEQALIEVEVTNGPAAQIIALNNIISVGSQDEIMSELNDISTRICLELRPVNGGPFENTIELNVEPMLLPRSLDLEEEATA
jgi:hypothetical protein